MVRHDDRIRSGVDDGPGICRVEDALDDERPVPDGAEPGEVGDRRGRVEQAADELGDGALGALERGELERLGGEEVEPPRWVQRALREGLQRQGRRDGQAVADVAQPWPGDRGVDGEHERLVAGGLRPGPRSRGSPRGRATGRAGTTAARPEQLQLGPRSTSCPSSITRTGCRPVRRRGRLLARRRCASSGEAGRCKPERGSRGPAEDDCRGVHGRHVLKHVRAELDSLINLSRPTKSELVTGGAIGVVEDGARSSATGQHAQVGDGCRGSQPPIGRVERRTPRPEQRSHLGPSRHASSGHGRVLHDGARHR